MLKQGVPIRVVQDIAGHSTVNITLQIYGHVFHEDKKEAAQKVDAFLAVADKKAR